MSAAQSAYDFTVKDPKGDPVNLKEACGGKVCLFVNTALGCGFTPQFKGLQEIHDQYSAKGFAVQAFPSNDFNQDPGESATIAAKVCERFRTTFPVYGKVHVKGKECEPLFAYLKENSPVMFSKEIWWNFEKVLVGRDGKVLKRYGSQTSPTSMTKDIEKALATPAAGAGREQKF